MSNEPFNPMPWPKTWLLEIWGDWTAYIPQPIRFALWNWMFDYKGDDRVGRRKP